MKKYKNITVIGGGLMGCGVAQVFAYSEDHQVKVYDAYVTGDLILERIRSNMKLLVDKGVFTQEAVEAILARISTYDNMTLAVSEADFIIECVPEIMRLKQDLFADLDKICPTDTIFATNTSVMSITEIASKTVDKERVVGTHFWNPPYLIPLVEVIKAEGTSEATMDATMAILTKVGKHPIRVAKDVPGFVANRLQHALWREAISIVEHGIADAKTVDEAIKMSFGLRLPVLAPMENADMVGTDLTLSIHSYLLKFLENATEPSPLLKEKVEKGEFGFKSGKGFSDWSQEAIDQSRKQLTEHLIRMLYNK